MASGSKPSRSVLTRCTRSPSPSLVKVRFGVRVANPSPNPNPNPNPYLTLPLTLPLCNQGIKIMKQAIARALVASEAQPEGAAPPPKA